jgi:beta-glucosidase
MLMTASLVADAAPWGSPQTHSVDQRVDLLMAQMTLAEKIGQLNQYTGDWNATGPITLRPTLVQDLREGLVGSMLNVLGTRYTRQYQQEAMQSRLKIPLLFGQDVVHGYKTTFPIPLAEAASWDIPAITLAARVAATEAAASGIHWTFAPMVDVARDPRWGRVLEGAGEDTYLGSRIAAARVKGFQGPQLGATDAVMATAKHFAAYGAAVGGRDYNAVDMSLRQLWETYLPPFKAAVDAGAASFMNAFNVVNGVPATGHRYLLRDVLKGQWGFGGLVVSDWGSIGEMVVHGYVADKKGAALAGITAGTDIDMESNAYKGHLAELVGSGQVSLALVDDAVRRVLRKKFELGLFEDPYRFSDAAREQQALNNPAHVAAAREVAGKSIVLLKNENGLLPLSPATKTIAVIGPLVKAVKDNLGAWSIVLPDQDYDQLVVTQWAGLQQAVSPATRLLYAQGCDISGSSKAGFDEAMAAAAQADVVIVSVGESRDMSGEARSRASLQLPGVQEDLVKALHATGKPVVVLVNAGRPLTFNWIADHVPAVVYTWWLGTEAGHAIADVLFGRVNPSGKLPMSFPREVGQIPVYYNHFNTGRPPATDQATGYESGYIDATSSPRYVFGHGLSYTQFAYSDLRLSSPSMDADGRIEVQFTLTNTGERAGDEVVQLYLRDKVASLVRPLKELKDFAKLHLAPGQQQTVRFVIDREKLSFFNADLQWVAEPGEFELMLGASSADIRLRAGFELR